MTGLPKEWVASLALAVLVAAGQVYAQVAAPLFPAPPSAPLRNAPLPVSAEPAPASGTEASPPQATQVEAMTQRAQEMAGKGMHLAAREELVHALRLVAESIDARQNTDTRAASLADGLAALKEAADFSPAAGPLATLDVAAIARSHRTPILKETRGLSPVLAQQHYFQFAQQQLATAVSGEPAASQALFALGKTHDALAGTAAPTQSLHGPRAMVCYQAALAVDPGNYLAANELGVLLARYGHWQDARQALLHSVTVRPHAEGWHNLSIVHRRLGETDLARLAENERQLLARGPAARKPAADERIQWVDPQAFAARSAASDRR